MKKKIIKKATPMYDLGTQMVQVPPGGDPSSLIGDTLGGIAAGANLGKSFGPWGLGIGTAAGGAYGLYEGITNNNAATKAHNLAINTNRDITTLNQANGANEHYQGNEYLKRYRAKEGVSSIDKMKIEVEGNEAIFRRKAGRFELKRLAKGPTHEQGGIPYTAEEGDVIFPASMKDKVMDMYKDGNAPGMEALRRTLPDKPTSIRQYRKGTQSINTTYGEDHRQVDDQTHYGLRVPTYAEGIKDVELPELGVDADTREFRPQGRSMNSFMQPGNSTNINGAVPLPAMPNNPDTSGIGLQTSRPSLGSNLLSAAPDIYNIARGISEQPVQATPRYLKLNRYNYTDLSNPNRQQSNRVERLQINNARNTSGGNLQAYGAMGNQAMAANFGRQEDINNFEAGRRDNVYNQNVGLSNQENQYNTQENARVDQINMANRAAPGNFIAKGLTGLQQLSEKSNTDKQRQDLDSQLLKQLIPNLWH